MFLSHPTHRPPYPRAAGPAPVMHDDGVALTCSPAGASNLPCGADSVRDPTPTKSGTDTDDSRSLLHRPYPTYATYRPVASRSVVGVRIKRKRKQEEQIDLVTLSGAATQQRTCPASAGHACPPESSQRQQGLPLHEHGPAAVCAAFNG